METRRPRHSAEIIYEDDVIDLIEAFQEKRGFSPAWFFGRGDIDYALDAEADLKDIENGEHRFAEDPEHKEFCQNIVTMIKTELIRLIEDDDYYAKKRDAQRIGKSVIQKGERKAALNRARQPLKISNN
jgi:hypothetical protein